MTVIDDFIRRQMDQGNLTQAGHDEIKSKREKTSNLLGKSVRTLTAAETKTFLELIAIKTGVANISGKIQD